MSESIFNDTINSLVISTDTKIGLDSLPSNFVNFFLYLFKK